MRRFASLCTILALGALGACGDDTTGPASGSLSVEVTGLPETVAANVVVTGPGSYSATLTATQTLTDLPGGEYTITAAEVTDGDAGYGAIEPEQTVTVDGGTTRATVVYASLSSALVVDVDGLPANAPARVVVDGPDGYREELTASRMLPGLAPGTYSITASGVVVGDSTYQATVHTREVVVEEGATARAGVSYAAVAHHSLNLRVAAFYIVQSTQTRRREVPLVAGRDGYLRVFVVGDQANTATPTVRARIYHGDALRETVEIAASTPSVPSKVDEGDVRSSWNAFLPGAVIQPGMRIAVEVDPENAIVEANEADNADPATGDPLALDVGVLPPLRIRFVPIHQEANGLIGRVSEENKDTLLYMTRKLHPIPGYDADIRSPYTTKATLDPEGNMWTAVVSELDAVRVAEGSDRYYYGVVQTAYNGGGVVGIAAAIGARTALGWDRFPYAPETLAHELGHAWGRRHAPCNGAGGADPDYPYTIGLIGVYGMDVETGEVKPPDKYTDIMGYCDASWWISDYTYTGIFDYRAEHDAPVTAESPAKQPALLVWGRIEDGRLTLEPAFQLDTRPVLPSAPGPYRVEGLDDDGTVLFSLSFAGKRIPDRARDLRHFAFAVPLDAERASRLATLRLAGRGRETAIRAAAAERSAPYGPVLPPLHAASVRRVTGRSVAVTWDRSAHPMVMVRDPRTGEILSFARDGAAALRTSAGELELVFSDGVHSAARRVRVGGP
ncbi:MAG TPA: hypothetical protein VF212_04860 [Longimicrobiales bacterium]